MQLIELLIIGASAAIWGVVLLGAAGAAAYGTYLMWRTFLRVAIAGEGSIPRWIETHAPLRGKWLQLAIVTPGLILFSPFLFVALFVVALLFLPFILPGLAVIKGVELLLGVLGARSARATGATAAGVQPSAPGWEER